MKISKFILTCLDPHHPKGRTEIEVYALDKEEALSDWYARGFGRVLHPLYIQGVEHVEVQATPRPLLRFLERKAVLCMR